MHDMPATLAAISAGAVFMGANSYIGNAPNFMVRSIAEFNGVRMPSFFGYMVWSVGILVPLFALMTWLFFVALCVFGPCVQCTAGERRQRGQWPDCPRAIRLLTFNLHATA